MSCLRCQTPNDGICFWWCEELKNKLLPAFVLECKDAAKNVARKKKWWYKIWNKIQGIFKRR